MRLDNTPKWHTSWRVIHTPLNEISLHKTHLNVSYSKCPRYKVFIQLLHAHLKTSKTVKGSMRACANYDYGNVTVTVLDRKCSSA